MKVTCHFVVSLSEPHVLSPFAFSQHIESWLSSGQDHERERAVKTMAELLQFYLEHLNVKVKGRMCVYVQILHTSIRSVISDRALESLNC